MIRGFRRTDSRTIVSSQDVSGRPESRVTCLMLHASNSVDVTVGMADVRALRHRCSCRLSARSETLKALQVPKVRERLATLGLDPMVMTPNEFDAYVQKEIAVNAALVKAAGIKPE